MQVCFKKSAMVCKIPEVPHLPKQDDIDTTLPQAYKA